MADFSGIASVLKLLAPLLGGDPQQGQTGLSDEALQRALQGLTQGNPLVMGDPSQAPVTPADPSAAPPPGLTLTPAAMPGDAPPDAAPVPPPDGSIGASAAAIPGATTAPVPSTAPPPPGQNIAPGDVALPAAHPGLLRRIYANMAKGGGATPDQVQEIRQPGYKEQVVALRTKQARMLFPNDPVAQMMWAQGDPDFQKAVSANYKDENTPAGDSVRRNGAFITGPATKSGVEGPDAWTTDAKGNPVWGARRSPNYAEKTAAQEADTKAKEATIHGAEADAKISADQDKQVVNGVLKKATGPGGLESLNQAEKMILQTWVLHQTATAPGMMNQGQGLLTAGGLGTGPGGAPGVSPDQATPPPHAKPAKAPSGTAYPAPATFKGVNGKDYNIPSKKDGKVHRYTFSNGQLYDQGPAA